MTSSSERATRSKSTIAADPPGFIWRVRRGGGSEAPLSSLPREHARHYDSRDPSRLERMIAEPDKQGIDEALLSRARTCILALTAAGATRFNDQSTLPYMAPQQRTRVLVVDQPESSPAVQGARVHPGGVPHMLNTARQEYPTAEIILLVHPDTPLREAKQKRKAAGRVHATVVTAGVHPFEVVRCADHVFTRTSHLGFEALLLDKPVSCFGVPFYAGWGVTDDRVAVPRRGLARSVEQIFAAAYLQYCIYFDPHTGQRCELETIIEHVARQRDYFRQNQGVTYCFGFGPWKHNYVRAYLRSPDAQVRFSWSAVDAQLRGFDERARILLWGMRQAHGLDALARHSQVPIWRMEDGFLRSVGLGSDFYAPASLVVDREGIYFDPNRPSELESILERGGFTDSELARAQALREHIVRAEVSKYNVGDGSTTLVRPAGNRRVILVPGQVEDDASIQLGCVDVRTNEGLIRAVREQNPNAYIIFKPHPDVTSGNRKGGVATDQALRFCDQVIVDVPLPRCLAIADEVHTMTSLVGFEALMRGLTVAAYGRPFYSGWGLTRDRHTVERRTRTLSLDELVAGTLLRYPRYISHRTGLFTTPEVVVAELREQMEAIKHLPKVSRRTRKLRKLAQAVRGLLHAQ